MKFFFTVILLALANPSYSQEEYLMQDAITKPALGLRCKELLKERADKIKLQQRFNALLQRNEDLVKKTPQEKVSVQGRLRSNQIKIKHELHLINLSIETMEENIIRSGCPGISL